MFVEYLTKYIHWDGLKFNPMKNIRKIAPAIQFSYPRAPTLYEYEEKTIPVLITRNNSFGERKIPLVGIFLIHKAAAPRLIDHINFFTKVNVERRECVTSRATVISNANFSPGAYFLLFVGYVILIC